MVRHIFGSLYVLVVLLLFQKISAQENFYSSSLRAFIKQAETNYPVIAAKHAEAKAALANLSLQKNTLLPSLEAAYQANYSTYNNITGMSYPGLLLPISGPPTTENYNNAVPGSALSLLLKWTPITFGQRSASVEYSRKLYEKQIAGVEDEVLRVKFKVAYIYLEISSTKELIKTFQKNIERNEFNLKQSRALVTAGIRPAVDSLRFKGELSKSKTELYKIENLLETQKKELQEFLVAEEIQDIERSEFFVSTLPVGSPDSSGGFENPSLKMARFELQANQAHLQQISRSWTPKLEFWGTTYLRGSGISYDGRVNKPDGWSLSRYNYGVGFQLVFPILDLTNVKMKTNRQEAITLASESYFRQTQIALNSQEAIAMNNLNTSLLIANEVPVEFKASEESYRALQTRYMAGLIDYTELIQAQYNLLNAEATLKNVYVDSWKSLLKLATIRGDITIFLNQIPD